MDSKNLQESPVKTKLTAKQSKAELKLKAQDEQLKHQKMDKIKFFLAIIVASASVWGYYALDGKMPKLAVAALPIVGVAVALAMVFFWCDMGKRLTAYIKDSYVELKKVVWPERNDAIKTTLYVVAFVAVLAMFIYLADASISWLFFDVLLKRG